MKPKIKRAYQVSSPDFEEGQEIVFSHSKSSARKLGASLLGFHYDESEYEATWVSKYDKFVELGFVPPLELLNTGWYVHSAYWQKRLQGDMQVTSAEMEDLITKYTNKEWDIEEEGYYVPELIVESLDRKSFYINMEEVEEHAYSIKEFKDALYYFKEYVMQAYPDFEIVQWKGDYPSYTKEAVFTFPGEQYPGRNTIRWQTQEEPISTVGVWVVNGDLEAFNTWYTNKVSQKG